jgi:hypothetical protein
MECVLERSLAITALVGSATHPKHTYVQNFKPPSLLKISIKSITHKYLPLHSMIGRSRASVLDLETYHVVGLLPSLRRLALLLWLCTPAYLMQSSATNSFPESFLESQVISLVQKSRLRSYNLE